MTSREVAIRVLYQVEKNSAYSDKALKKELALSGLSAGDRAFATGLTYGVIRHKTRIDHTISHYSTQKINKISVWILSVLRIAVYQILFLDSIPAFAAINESVNLAKRFGHPASARFTNAVLRAAAKGGEPKIDSIEIYYSHPKWLVDLLKSQYPNDYKKILSSNNTIAPATVRVNTLKTTSHQLCNDLSAKGIEVYADGDIITMSKFGDISALDEYKNGMFIPQDKGAYLAAAEVKPRPNQIIMDVCAAPGAKTTQLAQYSDDLAQITAFDIYTHKIRLIQKNAERMGMKSVNTQIHDAREVNAAFIDKADSVLADVPCSGLGIIRKKPDIKWTKTPEDIENIIKVQKEILEASSRYVKPGGVLVYSTCTVNRHENNDVTDEFIKSRPFRKIGEKQLLTHIDNCDGFYYCKIQRMS